MTLLFSKASMAYSEPKQKSKIDLILKIVIGFKQLPSRNKTSFQSLYDVADIA